MLAASAHDKCLSEAGISVLRRLAFDWGRLKWRINHQTEDDAERCRRGLHKDCGR